MGCWQGWEGGGWGSDSSSSIKKKQKWNGGGDGGGGGVSSERPSFEFPSCLPSSQTKKERQTAVGGAQVHSSILAGRAGTGGRRRLAHGRPWLPRGRATALRGGATELMGDVIIFLLSKTQNSRRDKEKGEGGGEREREERVGDEGEGRKSLEVQYRGSAARGQCWRVWLREGHEIETKKEKRKQRPGGSWISCT